MNIICACKLSANNYCIFTNKSSSFGIIHKGILNIHDNDFSQFSVPLFASPEKAYKFAYDKAYGKGSFIRDHKED